MIMLSHFERGAVAEVAAPIEMGHAIQSRVFRSSLGLTPSRLRKVAVIWAWNAKPDARAIALRSSVTFCRSVRARETRRSIIWS